MSVSQLAQERVHDFSVEAFGRRLKEGLNLQIGPFAARINADPESLIESLYSLYGDYALLADDSVCSFHARLNARRNFPRYDKEVVRFSVDGRAPHEDMPAEQALHLLGELLLRREEPALDDL